MSMREDDILQATMEAARDRENELMRKIDLLEKENKILKAQVEMYKGVAEQYNDTMDELSKLLYGRITGKE